MLFGFSIWVILIAVAIVALISFIYDIEWYKVAIVVIAVLFVSGLYRDGKLPEKLEPIAEKVFFWVDKEAEAADEIKESKDLAKEEEKGQMGGTKIKDLWNSLIRRRIFGIRLWTLLVAISAVWWLNCTWDIDLHYLIPFAAVFLIVAFLYSNDKLPEFLEPAAGRVYRAENNIDEERIYRPSYDVGTCRDLSGYVCVLCVFVNDDESSWTAEEASAFKDNIIKPATVFLNEQAANYGVYLDIKVGEYVEGEDDNIIPVQYDGVIPTVLDGEHTDREELLDNLAKSLDFRSSKTFYSHTQEVSYSDQVVIMMLVNKDGRSHAGPDTKADDADDIENYVVYSSLNGNKTRSGTVAHELLHAFGAEDLYEEKSTGERAARAAIAKEHYPNDIMLGGWNDNAVVGAYTAYAVGWTDEVPEICTSDEFWEGHWSRE